MVRRLLNALLLSLYSENGEKSNGTNPSFRELDDVTSAETRRERRIILHVDTTDMRPPIVVVEVAASKGN